MTARLVIVLNGRVLANETRTLKFPRFLAEARRHHAALVHQACQQHGIPDLPMRVTAERNPVDGQRCLIITSGSLVSGVTFLY